MFEDEDSSLGVSGEVFQSFYTNFQHIQLDLLFFLHNHQCFLLTICNLWIFGLELECTTDINIVFNYKQCSDSRLKVYIFILSIKMLLSKSVESVLWLWETTLLRTIFSLHNKFNIFSNIFSNRVWSSGKIFS